MFRNTRIVLYALSLSGLLAAGCTHGGPGGGQPAGGQVSVTGGVGGAWSAYEANANYAQQHGTVVYQVTYQPNAVVFDLPTTERTLKNISGDGNVYTLDASSPQAQALKPGSVLLLYGVAIRKVSAVTAQGQNIAVTTTPADITDAIKDGHISWHVPIDFSQPLPAQTQGLDNLFATPALADGTPFSFGGTANKFKFNIGFGFGPPGRLNINVDGVYNEPDASMRFKGQGYIGGFFSSGHCDINDGTIDRFDYSTNGLHGHVAFTWEAARKQAGALSLIDRQFKLKFPYKLQRAFLIGPLPFILEVSAAVLIHPAFTSKNSIVSGQFTVDYGGDAGLTVSSSAPQPQGTVEGTDSIGPGTTALGLGALGFVAALELPRVELSLALIPPTEAMELDSIMEGRQMAKDVGLPDFMMSRSDLASLIKGWLMPVKPYAFVNVVTATGMFTNGAIMSGLLPLPPCQRAQIKATVNAGVGVKLNLTNINAILGKINEITGPKVEFAATSKPIWTMPLTKYLTGVKCPGDS